MENLDVRVVAASSSLASRATEIRLTSSSRIRTPKRALFLGSNPLSEARFVPPGPSRGVVEVFRAIDKNQVSAIDSDNERQRDYMNHLIPKHLQPDLQDELVLVVLRLFDRSRGEYWLPNDRETDYLADLLAAMPTAVVVPPTTTGVKIDATIDFLKRFTLRVRSNSSKPVLGMIPYQTSWRDQERIQEFYRREGFTGYVWDLHGRTPSGIGPNLRSVVSHLGEVEREHGPHFAHALNVKYSQERRTRPSLPARDLLLLYEAFDSFGAAHLPPRLPEEVWKTIADNPVPPVFRLFSAKEYGYNVVSQKQLSTEVRTPLRRAGKDSLLDRNLDATEWKALSRLVNAERMADEAVTIEAKIREGTDSTYLARKTGVAQEVAFTRELASAYRSRPSRSGLDSMI